MRLISVHDYSLCDFSGRDTPPYAILSHTWGADEVSYQDMQELSVARRRKGFRKIELCCAQAHLDGWAWAWVDTCCIDKTSSVELSEAINSMFQWYARSMVCYVYLSDWYGGGLRACRWFGRGWTLQELLAPLHVQFFNYKWERMGTKKDLKAVLSDITGVPTSVLDQSEQLSEQTIGSRMHWASRRKTTREEDMSYCLLGIFDVNMPLLYGEGSKRAFLRLQEEIVKKWDDHTLFIWD
ncbi:Heterokaryon incompatibility protein (HET) domain containing protein, partial [Naviculisporaceae sp. PSN 640]